MNDLFGSIHPMTWLLEPLSHEFMRRALMVSALVGGVCGLLSCYMTLKGWALMGDAVSHAVMPGVVVAYALGLPFSIGAFVFGVGSVALIGFIKQKSRIKEDTVIGLVFTGFFALGLVLVSKINGCDFSLNLNSSTGYSEKLSPHILIQESTRLLTCLNIG